MKNVIMQKKDYQFLKIIGKGAFAKVYLAENSQKQQFAIKVISIDFNGSQSQKQLQYFEQEIQIYKNIQNDNVVSLIEEFREIDEIYCVFEYCSNGDLNNFLKNSILDEDEIKSIFIEILKGMKYIYQKGIVHRDLKIDNILIDENKVVKIADFGFAKYYSKNDILTSYCGTPATMAPEILNQEQYDYKCDIWSLGVILYYMIYRKYHFSNKIRSLIDLAKELENFQLKFDENKFKLSDMGKDFLSKMLDTDKTTRIDYENLFAHPWLQGALIDQDNMKISKIIINKQFVNQESRLIGGIVKKFKDLKTQFLTILNQLQILCNDQIAKQQFFELYKLIDIEKQYFNFQCSSIIQKQNVPIIDYKVESYKTLEVIYKQIQFNHLDMVMIESQLIDFLNQYPLSNSITIILKGQYTYEELENVQKNIREVDMDLNFQELNQLYKLETEQLNSQLENRVVMCHLGRQLKLEGMQIQQFHQNHINKPLIDLQL
ncbi:unnamed protein product [Paramecium primaurelia]|uniref:Protein kinase domain-containing protein n=1 Tax=Paramecium primaurelia TaxID=5886 RepID=A0A8S1PXD6_PARPR|nr:unnamed protein product [Paramecium primaurelia]